jgi:hypothetical protein
MNMYVCMYVLLEFSYPREPTSVGVMCYDFPCTVCMNKCVHIRQVPWHRCTCAVRIHMCIDVRVRIHMCAYSRVCACLSPYECLVHVHMCTRSHLMCMYNLKTFLWPKVIYIYIYIYIHTHTHMSQLPWTVYTSMMYDRCNTQVPWFCTIAAKASVFPPFPAQ